MTGYTSHNMSIVYAVCSLHMQICSFDAQSLTKLLNREKKRSRLFADSFIALKPTWADNSGIFLSSYESYIDEKLVRLGMSLIKMNSS